MLKIGCSHDSVAYYVNVVEIIAESHANWFSDCQIVYMEKAKIATNSWILLNGQIRFDWQNSELGKALMLRQ